MVITHNLDKHRQERYHKIGHNLEKKRRDFVDFEITILYCSLAWNVADLSCPRVPTSTSALFNFFTFNPGILLSCLFLL